MRGLKMVLIQIVTYKHDKIGIKIIKRIDMDKEVTETCILVEIRLQLFPLGIKDLLARLQSQCPAGDCRLFDLL